MADGPGRRQQRSLLRRIAVGMPGLREAIFLARTFPLVIRAPRIAIAIANSRWRQRDPMAVLAEIDVALTITRSAMLYRRRALVADKIGALTLSRDAWLAAAGLGDPGAALEARLATGRLVELDPAWLPRPPGERALEPIEPASRRRVLHILKSSGPERWAGFTIRTMHNLRAQRDSGLDPVAVTEIGWPRVVGVTDIKPVIDVEGIAHHRLDRGPDYPLDQVPNDVRMIDTVADLERVVREVRPAVLHAHSGNRGGEQALMALALRERFGIPVVYEVRGVFESVWTNDTAMAERSELYARRLEQETRILREVDGIIAISEALAADMVARGIERDRITIVPNGIAPASFAAAERDEDLRTQLGLGGRFVVGYVGNLDHWREGMDVLIRAVAELHRRGRSGVAALIVGDGVERDALEARAANAGLAAHVRFTGRIPHDRIARYYAQYDVFANPRHDERASRLITPLKPYEAMALG
ncbi:MAG TPA: glycosyltransferase, partial [Candidatus Limnocylindrales bacterium]|nr:glycosyltransferase [Candidatus Limnocylindrales bacterium]